MFLKVLIQSLLIGFSLLVLHVFSHAWPILAEKQEIIDAFSGPMMIIYYLFNVLAFPLDHLLGWTWTTFQELNMVGPVLLGFPITGYMIRRKNAKVGVANA